VADVCAGGYFISSNLHHFTINQMQHQNIKATSSAKWPTSILQNDQ